MKTAKGASSGKPVNAMNEGGDYILAAGIYLPQKQIFDASASIAARAQIGIIQVTVTSGEPGVLVAREVVSGARIMGDASRFEDAADFAAKAAARLAGEGEVEQKQDEKRSKSWVEHQVSDVCWLVGAPGLAFYKIALIAAGLVVLHTFLFS
jgi:hypothetical protein